MRPGILTPKQPIAPKPQAGITQRVIKDVIRSEVRTAHPAAQLHPTQMRSKVLRRESVTPVRPDPSAKKPLASHRITQQKAITGIAAILIIVGLWIGFTGFRANKEVAATSQRLAEQSDTVTGNGSGAPAEGSKPDVGSYKVAANLPRVIRIPKYNIDARIVRVGVKANNQLVAPSNIHDTGWYEASSKPGEGGAVLIDGHVSGPTKHGVFYNLKKLVAGDQIEVERGDGKRFTYRVIRTKSYPADKVDMAAALVSVTAGKPGLNLVTCDGALDASRNHYKDRLVVFAEQM